MANNLLVEITPQQTEALMNLDKAITDLVEFTVEINNMKEEIEKAESRLNSMINHSSLDRSIVHGRMIRAKNILNHRIVITEMIRQYKQLADDYVLHLIAGSPLGSRPQAVICRSFEDIQAVWLMTYILELDYHLYIAVEDNEVANNNNNNNNNQGFPRAPPQVLANYAEQRGLHVIWV